MNKRFRFIAPLLVAAAFSANARHTPGRPVFSVRLPASKQIAPATANYLSKKLNQLALAQQSLSQHKTAAAEKLLAMSVYDFRAAPNQQFIDSFRFTYDSSRGSAYDYLNLMYDLDNTADFPYNSNGVLPISGYLNYDSMRAYQLSGSATNVDFGLRQYNIFNKVSVSEHPINPDITFFDYDPFAKLIKSTVMDNSNGVGLDSAYRDFYKYNTTTGFIERDSIETWDGTTWKPEAVFTITNNAGGNPVQENIYFVTPGGNVLFATLDLVYASNNTDVTGATISGLNSFPGSIVPFSKDTFVYTTGMLTSHDSYNWDTATNNWIIGSMERRHLNTSALVDSVFSRFYDDAGHVIDSSIQKIVYNNSDHPTYQRDYTGNGSTKTGESRYYYSLPVPAGVSNVKSDISLYPNPAKTELSVKGLAGSRFTITNAAGQLLINGVLTAQTRISIASLSAGVYQITAQDASGKMHTGSFIKE